MTEGWVEYLTGPWGFVFAFAAGVLSFLSPCVLPLVPAYLAHLTGTTAALPCDNGVRMTEGWVEYLTGPWGFVFAFAAGVLSFLSPCVLPLVPAYLAHLTGTTATLEGGPSTRRSALTHAAFFVGGFAMVFSLLAASVGLLGYFLSADDSFFFRTHGDLIRQIAGVVLIVLGLNLMGVIKIPILYRQYSLELAGAGAGGGGMATAGASGGDGAKASSLQSVNADGRSSRLRRRNGELLAVGAAGGGVRGRVDAVHRAGAGGDLHAGDPVGGRGARAVPDAGVLARAWGCRSC